MDVAQRLKKVCFDVKSHPRFNSMPVRDDTKENEDGEANMFGFSWESSRPAKSLNDQITQDESWHNSASVKLMGDSFQLGNKDYYKSSYPAADKNLGCWTMEELRVKQSKVWSRQTLAFAESLVEKGKYEQSISHYLDALKYDPDSIIALVRMAEAKAALGQFENAKTYYKEALQLDPNNKHVVEKLQGLTIKQDYDLVFEPDEEEEGSSKKKRKKEEKREKKDKKEKKKKEKS